MTKRILWLIAWALLITAVTSQARLRENPEQCDHRYGEPVFKNGRGDMEYRSYRFSGKKIRVCFYRSESVFEMIVTGPHSVVSGNQLEKMVAESISFFRGLLSSAYQFIEEQLESLARFERSGRDTTSSSAVNGAVRATLMAESTANQKAFTVTSIVGNTEAVANVDGWSTFFGESVVLEHKHAEAEKAGGF